MSAITVGPEDSLIVVDLQVDFARAARWVFRRET